MAFELVNTLSIKPPNQTAILLNGLRIAYNIVKTLERSTNKCEISVYNLRADTVKKIKQDSVVELKTGYADEGGLKNIFFGEIQRAENVDDALPDLRTAIYCYDGLINLRSPNISISYIAGVKVSTIVADLTNAIGLPVFGANLIPVNVGYANAYSFIGSAQDSLAEVLAFVGLRYSIQNNNIIISDGRSPAIADVYELSALSGLLRRPEDINDRDESQENVEELPQRYKVTHLIIPEILPESRISLTSSTANGIFKVEKASFNGDNYGNNNYMELEVVAI